MPNVTDDGVHDHRKRDGYKVVAAAGSVSPADNGDKLLNEHQQPSAMVGQHSASEGSEDNNSATTNVMPVSFFNQSS